VSLAECISSLDGNQERGLVMGGDLCTDEKEGRGCRCECWVLGAGCWVLGAGCWLRYGGSTEL
jgi:hypothetical protein